MLFRSRTFTLSTLSLALFSHFSSAADSELNLDFLQGINMTPSVLKSGTHYPLQCTGSLVRKTCIDTYDAGR
ncbi:hypothetical protein AB8965_12910 [Yersinia enterocolitica]|uniref:hypothetical protein n=1 Tax=Yersinia enterocolitica TaxID=630 RepID=UPI003CFCAE0E